MSEVALREGPSGLGGFLYVIGIRLFIGMFVLAVSAAGDQNPITLIFLGYQGFLIYTFLKEKKVFQTAYIFVSSFLMLIFVIAAIVAMLSELEEAATFIGCCIGEAGFLAYIIFSKRVQNTFIN